MKKLLALALALACILPAGGCGRTGQPQEDLSGESGGPETSSAERALAGPEEDLSQLSSQELAQRAYEQILDSFGGLLPHDPGYPGYPEEFGDAYYEDGCIVVCLTDNSQEMQEKYRALVDTPELLRFREVDYSYNDLYALFEAVTRTEGLAAASVGVDVEENQVVVGIPDLSAGEEALAAIREGLPQELEDRFSQLPITFREEDYATLS